MKVAVIGSGPSGWAATRTLVSLGHEVTIVDAGLVETDKFNTDSVLGASTLNQKLYFGSDLPYRSFPFGPTSDSFEVNPIKSFAQGGLSLVWGATMLPYCYDDTVGWPLNVSELDEYFHQLSKQIPITGTSDGLSDVYGDFYSRRGILPSNRIVRFLESCNQDIVRSVQVGLSRLAVETGTRELQGCVYCNKCIGGCPFNLIWNSREMHSNVKYVKMRVLKLSENNSEVTLETIDVNGKVEVLSGFEKVFLAAGSLESFRVLANSKIVGDEGILKDSATYFIPLLVLPRLRSKTINSFGLSQVFIRLSKDEKHVASQFQIYEYSDELIKRAQKALPLGHLLPKAVLRIFLKRMMVAIGYLDGKASPSIRMTLLQSGSIYNEVCKRGVNLKERNKTIKNAVSRLSKYTRPHGLLPIPFLTQTALPGEGVHFGSWLPMGDKSDLLGRPNGAQNIHVIDSSVLPSVAPGPITFTVMANAMRIAKEAVK